jgi:hypothetical protein
MKMRTAGKFEISADLVRYLKKFVSEAILSENVPLFAYE